jgi:hypothetical protein
MTKRKSLARTARTWIHTISLTDALLRIRSFDVNKNKRQAKHSYYIRRRSQTRRARKTPLTITTLWTIKTVISSAETWITSAYTRTRRIGRQLSKTEHCLIQKPKHISPSQSTISPLAHTHQHLY